MFFFFGHKYLLSESVCKSVRGCSAAEKENFKKIKIIKFYKGNSSSVFGIGGRRAGTGR